MWTDKHKFTLINKTALDAAKLANDSNVNAEGESSPLQTPEYGIQMTQQGYDSYLCNIAPSLCNVDNTLCMIRGCHVMHAIKYMTIEQVKELAEKWQSEYKIDEVE